MKFRTLSVTSNIIRIDGLPASSGPHERQGSGRISDRYSRLSFITASSLPISFITFTAVTECVSASLWSGASRGVSSIANTRYTALMNRVSSLRQRGRPPITSSEEDEEFKVRRNASANGTHSAGIRELIPPDPNPMTARISYRVCTMITRPETGYPALGLFQ